MTEARPVRALALAGLSATWIALTLGYWMPAIGLPRMDLALWNGNLLVPATSTVGFAWTIGALQTLGLGTLLGIAYGRVMRDQLPGASALRGAIWGVVIGVVVGMVLMPLLYGAGLFGVRWDPLMPISIGIWHLTWGTAVGVIERL
ncbi:MAG: hypothetical protein GKS06_17155 [Acidobacteria bacterium]|nr:hypothetical protein [Acidobacteriota bacterium]